MANVKIGSRFSIFRTYGNLLFHGIIEADSVTVQVWSQTEVVRTHSCGVMSLPNAENPFSSPEPAVFLLSNAIIAAFTIGALGAIATGVIYFMKAQSLLAFLTIGAVAGAIAGGVAWLIIRPKAESGSQKFIMNDPQDCVFVALSASPKTRNLDSNIVVSVSNLQIANNTGGTTTLKEVTLAYKHMNLSKEIPDFILPTGKVKSGKDALMFFNEKDNLFVHNWKDIRSVILQDVPREQGGIWRGI